MKITVIGLGKMGSSIIRGILDNEIFAPGEIIGCDVKVQNKSRNSEYGGIKTVNDNVAGAEESDIILLAVKPQIMKKVLNEIKTVSEDKLIISVAAGITLDYLKKSLSPEARIIRVMPNTPALVKAGMSAYTPGDNVTEKDLEVIKNILEGIGKVVAIKEELMDVVTGLSGSGPAYGYMIIEALSDGGVLKGLDREEAIKLAAQTMLGAAKMVLETDKHPGELKDMVTSPGGTTITAVETLEKRGLRGILIEAVKKATEKSKELG
ncbi:MAG: pyrroline-5-carboxylate reductase [Halanaerobiales bacterium]